MRRVWEQRSIETLLGAVIAFNAWNAVRADDTFVRVLTIATVVLLTFLVAYRLGHHRAVQGFVEATSWIPRDVTWHEDDDGNMHALVTTHAGDVRSIALPPNVASGEEAFEYIMRELFTES